jgi:Mg-chelatase subunit ChlD
MDDQIITHEEVQVQIQATKNRYLIMFTIDGSGSMAGSKWKQICNAIENFIGKLGDDDLVSAIVFNS